MTQEIFEINFDGLVGPTHHYGGLSTGNMASQQNSNQISQPRMAALQGLEKMKQLYDLGIPQAVLPPQDRPCVDILRLLGYSGTDANVLLSASRDDLQLLSACSASSSMWTANAGTVSPSSDCLDGKVHITPANLASKFHRSLEAGATTRIFGAIFNDPEHFVIHEPLPSNETFGDEGGANHTRFCADELNPGCEFFVFGRYAFQPTRPKPKYFPARQTYEASSAIIRRHGLKPECYSMTQQNPSAIDQGVFHNDVISVGHRNMILFHDQAFFDSARVVDDLSAQFLNLTGKDLIPIRVSNYEITVPEAVQTYLFNSQIVTSQTGEVFLICPIECQENRVVKKTIERIIADTKNPISKVYYLNLRQSMANGGGPACLRLRVTLSEQERNKMNQAVLFTPDLYEILRSWIDRYYRNELTLNDLADPELLKESRHALDELTRILKLGNIYDFQK